MKIYKHYFNKNDTPYVQDYQPRKKYHTAWKRFKYRTFLGHKVVKIKVLGIFTIYDITKGSEGYEKMFGVRNTYSDT